MSHEARPLKVVIVDDSVPVQRRLETMSAAIPGVDVVASVGSVAAALEVIGRLQPDALILDLRLGDGTGIDLLQEMAGRRQAPATIMLTAYPLPQHEARCRALGADYFFDKSLEFERVTEALAVLRDRKQTARETVIDG